ncbi:diol dehydratase small subunit [Geosporobacter ferrireducens]|uniref:Propanediol dehydratase n=1 Tax=Geosporobacter ferrireducens TaxID=1424294 RepID=A0A1D8GK93_9FIRM|nr:diol dehydratase small subunit [Geosporobacter ferrireducens]AOT71333.1 propanediol dehydratase [Geosporobacter ferrireducens]MTI57644.1 diol dehydratase small subunit [Geosporobacter ferrireducens]
MNQQQLIEQMVKEVMASLGAAGKSNEVKSSCAGTVSKADYPLGEKRPELLKSPTGKSLKEITLDKVIDGSVNSADVRISPETLELQAQVAESVGRDAFAKNLRRAAELIAVPDERILQIYNALRPYRSTKQELLEIADELGNKYGAAVNAAFVREAAEVYEKRNRLRQD